MKHTKFIAQCGIVCAALLSLGVGAAAQRMGRQDYVSRYARWAVDEMKRTGIPASITLAQGILESDCGNSDLAVDANNHFGIKCHNDWYGPTFHKDDDRANECFRSYESAYQSFVDHSDFIKTKKRYAQLFELNPTDYKKWAKGLKAAGYATEPTYADRLIKIIEEEGLHKYDDPNVVISPVDPTKDNNLIISPNPNANKGTVADVSNGNKETNAGGNANNSVNGNRRPTPSVRRDFAIEPFPTHVIDYNNGVRYVEVLPGDSFESIASEFHMQTWEIYKYNELDQSADIKTMRYVYLRPKKNRSHPDVRTYEVREGDTMWSIAHRHGVKLSRLMRRNGLSAGQEPQKGSLIRMR